MFPSIVLFKTSWNSGFFCNFIILVYLSYQLFRTCYSLFGPKRIYIYIYTHTHTFICWTNEKVWKRSCGYSCWL